MTLADFSNISSVVSGLAVLVSLIYLSLQLRQGARHQKAIVHHDRLGHLEAYLASVFGNAELMNLQMRGQAADSTLTDIEVNRFVFMQYANLLFYQEYFLMYSDGMISADRYGHAVNNLRLLASEPGTRAAWKTLRTVFATAFVAFMDRLVEETPVVVNPGFFATAFREAAQFELAGRHVPP